MPNRRNGGCLEECRKRMTGRVIGVMALGIVCIVIIALAIGFHVLPSEDSVSSFPLLQFRPNPENGEITLIHVDAKGDWKQHIEPSIDEFIEGYRHSEQEASLVSSCNSDSLRAPSGTSCYFDVNLLGRCSYKGDRTYGFDIRQPCFYLNPNKFDGWEPEYYKNMTEVPEKVPKQVHDAMAEEAGEDGELPARLWVSCEGKYPADTENMGPVEFLPRPYFASYYFPYRKEISAYYAPVVAVRFRAIIPGVLIHVVCRAWAKNIEDMRPSVQWEMLFD